MQVLRTNARALPPRARSAIAWVALDRRAPACRVLRVSPLAARHVDGASNRWRASCLSCRTSVEGVVTGTLTAADGDNRVGMTTISYARHRFPPDVIRHAVWLYLRFTLSYRDVEELLAERGVCVS